MNKFPEWTKIVTYFVLACIIFIVLCYGIIHIIAYFKIETSAVLAISMVVGSVLAYYNIKTNQKIARQEAMLDFVNDYNNSVLVSKGHEVIRNEAIPIEACLEKGEARDCVLSLLNRFEILAVGLDAGIYDPKMAVTIFSMEIHETWDYAEPIIEHIQKTEDVDSFSNIKKMIDRYFSKGN